MKTYILFILSFFTFSTLLTGQSFNEGSAATVGFGEIGVVATEGNYQSAYFQNPALLAQSQHQLDIFMNYGRSNLFSESISGGAMLNFNKNAIGIGFEHTYTTWSDDFNNNYSVIPLLYARNLYQTEKAGISIGANLNIHHNSYAPTNWLTPSPSPGYTITYLTGGMGVSAYRTVNLNHAHSLRFDFGASTNNLGPDALNERTGNGIVIKNFYKIGSMVGWQYKRSENKQFDFNVAYQLGKLPDFGSSFETVEYLHHLGIEARNTFGRNMYWAIRGGIIWEDYTPEIQYHETIVGASLNIKGFSLDLAFFPERGDTGEYMQVGLGYQKALSK